MTKNTVLYLAMLLSMMSMLASAAPKNPRQRLTFDQGWTFRLCKDKQDAVRLLDSLGVDVSGFGLTTKKNEKNKVTDDTEPEQAQVTASELSFATSASSLYDNSFHAVSVPHDWSIHLPFDPAMGGSAGYLAGGQGLYVKDFRLPTSLLRQEHLEIVFDGVYHRATVWLNGHRLGHHMYGYTGFSFNLTPYINKHGVNRLVMHVDREEQSRWYTGSGIYRHVWIVGKGATHVKENGIFVLPQTDGTITITAEIVGEGSMTHRVLDSDGKVVARGRGNSLKVSHPKLWDIDSPVMYRLVSQLRDAKGRLTDEVVTPFGFRDIRFDAETGFWLNDRNVRLKGVCLHQDAGSLGVAVPDEVWERRLNALKSFGCNAIRMSHNPPSPEFLNICDTLGLVVIDEAFDKWKSGYYEPFFDANAVGDITDMVKRDRNHPCVIVWSIGNEVSEAWNKDNVGAERARMLNRVVKSLDTSRPTMLGCQQGFEDRIANEVDIVGYNYLEPRMIADHRRYPKRKMLVSEAFVYYSGMRENLVRDFVEHNPWHFVEDHPFIAGSFVWAGVDYLGESSPWPAKGWCSCPFDMTMKERPQAAYYHAAWKPEEDYLKLVVRDNCFDQAVGTDHWQYPPMADTWDLPYTDSRCVEIRCYTTCDSVQFFFPMWTNPQLPLKPRVTADYPDNCITIQLPAREGKVLAVGYKGGKAVMRDSLINHGPVTDVRLDADHLCLNTIAPDFSPATAQNTVSHIRLTLVDSLGRTQQMQPRRFRVETEGPIRLLGVETGDMRRKESWRTVELPTYFGEGLIRVQSTTEPGIAKVKVYVEGFEKTFVLELRVKS